MEKRAYAQRVREIEHSSFTPLVMSASGGLAKEATNFGRLEIKIVKNPMGHQGD